MPVSSSETFTDALHGLFRSLVMRHSCQFHSYHRHRLRDDLGHCVELAHWKEEDSVAAQSLRLVLSVPLGCEFDEDQVWLVVFWVFEPQLWTFWMSSEFKLCTANFCDVCTSL